MDKEILGRTVEDWNRLIADQFEPNNYSQSWVASDNDGESYVMSSDSLAEIKRFCVRYPQYKPVLASYPPSYDTDPAAIMRAMEAIGDKVAVLYCHDDDGVFNAIIHYQIGKPQIATDCHRGPGRRMRGQFELICRWLQAQEATDPVKKKTPRPLLGADFEDFHLGVPE